MSLDQGEPLFTPEELLWLEGKGSRLHRLAGHVFFEEGEETDFVVLILSGHVKVSMGDPKRMVAVRGPQDVVGEMASLARKPRTASVEAIDEVEALLISASPWSEFLALHPRAMLARLAAMDTRLDRTTRKIVASELAVEQRLARAVIELVESGLGRTSDEGIELRIYQQELADFAGISLESVKKLIRAFKGAAIVTTSRQQMLVHDLAALREIAQGKQTASA